MVPDGSKLLAAFARQKSRSRTTRSVLPTITDLISPYPIPLSSTAKMVKLTEVEDEHFSTEKPTATKNDALLVSDDEDEDYSDTGT